jgi:hypothetical protein
VDQDPLVSRLPFALRENPCGMKARSMSGLDAQERGTYLAKLAVKMAPDRQTSHAKNE